MRDVYLYTLLKNSWISIVSKEELLSMLSAEELHSAIKSVINKPIGTALYDIVSKNIFNLNEVEYKLTSFNNERLINTYNRLGTREKKLIDKLNELFDITNLYFALLLINTGRRVSIIYPIGRLAIVDWRDVNDIDTFRRNIPRELVEVVDSILSLNISDLSNLLSIYTRIKPITSDLLINRVLMFLRDSILVKTCMFVKQIPAKGVSLLTMYSSDFENICSTRDLKILPQILQGINPLYSGFSELIIDLFSIKESYELIDLGIVLYSLFISSDLIDTLERVVIRTYLLYLSEAMIIRMILSLIDSKLYVDRFRDIVTKWWPL